jgi:mRNA deadenylase 3'-5' endonuclease subunit Ccr4
MTVVGTWNLENLFRPGTEFGPSSEAIFNRKAKLLAQTIRDFNVDVLGVQEVGSSSAFDAVIDELGAGWTGVLSTHFEPKRPIRVGFLSRVPLDATSITRSRSSFKPRRSRTTGDRSRRWAVALSTYVFSMAGSRSTSPSRTSSRSS